MSSSGHRTLTYRPDLDGLRAVAVVAVLIFHLAPEVLTGGFAGVDVFFVLSGFLISSITFTELDRGIYSLRQFYGRRVRRLFPALAVVVPVTLLAGAVVMSGDEFALLGKHVVAAVTYVSNFVLWREAGYFDASSELKPLLHLWSLAVEEHFYLLWPLFIAAVGRFGWSRSRWVGWGAVASFVLGLVAIASGRAAGFYLSPARFWEILIGSALASHAFGPRVSARAREWVAAGALALLLASFVWLTGARRYPGFTALWPTLATAALIWAGPATAVARVVLGGRAVVAIGRISYPLYLWHWPVIVFGKLIAPAHGTSPTLRAAALVGSFALAALTYRFVEAPAQRRLDPRTTAWWLLAPWICTGLLGAVVVAGAGFPNRYPDFDARMRRLEPPAPDAGVDATCPPDMKARLNFCRRTGPARSTRAVIGDSHANHLLHGLGAADPGRGWLLLGNGHCPPALGFNGDESKLDCDGRIRRIIAHLADDHAIDTVVLAFYGPYAVRTGAGGSSTAFRDGLDDVIGRLEAVGKRVVVVADVPELPFDPRGCVRRPVAIERISACTLARARADAERSGLNDVLESVIERHPRARVYDPTAVLCDAEMCYAERDDRVLYLDTHHLSDDGSVFVGRDLVRWFEAVDAH